MSIIRAGTTDPDLITRLRQMRSSATSTDIAVAHLPLPGFQQIAGELGNLRKTRIIIGSADHAALEGIAAGIEEANAPIDCSKTLGVENTSLQ